MGTQQHSQHWKAKAGGARAQGKHGLYKTLSQSKQISKQKLFPLITYFFASSLFFVPYQATSRSKIALLNILPANLLILFNILLIIRGRERERGTGKGEGEGGDRDGNWRGSQRVTFGRQASPSVLLGNVSRFCPDIYCRPAGPKPSQWVCLGSHLTTRRAGMGAHSAFSNEF